MNDNKEFFSVHPYILNNQKKRKQKQNQNSANLAFFNGKNNNIHSNAPYQNTDGTPQGHHLQTHTYNRINNRNTLLNNNIYNNFQNRLRRQGRKHNKQINNNLASFGEHNRPLSQNEKNRINRFIKNSIGPSPLELEEEFLYSPEQQLRRYEIPFEVNNLNRQPRKRSNRKTKKRRPKKRRHSTYNNNVSNYVVLNSNKVKRAKGWNSIKNTGRKLSARTKRGVRYLKRRGNKLTNRIKRSFKKSKKKTKAELNNHIEKLETKIDELSTEQVRLWARDGPQVIGETALTGTEAAPSRITDILLRARVKLDELKQERNSLN
jgi:hypothetical protein